MHPRNPHVDHVDHACTLNMAYVMVWSHTFDLIKEPYAFLSKLIKKKKKTERRKRKLSEVEN